MRASRPPPRSQQPAASERDSHGKQKQKQKQKQTPKRKQLTAQTRSTRARATGVQPFLSHRRHRRPVVETPRGARSRLQISSRQRYHTVSAFSPSLSLSLSLPTLPSLPCLALRFFLTVAVAAAWPGPSRDISAELPKVRHVPTRTLLVIICYYHAISSARLVLLPPSPPDKLPPQRPSTSSTTRYHHPGRPGLPLPPSNVLQSSNGPARFLRRAARLTLLAHRPPGGHPPTTR